MTFPPVRHFQRVLLATGALLAWTSLTMAGDATRPLDPERKLGRNVTWAVDLSRVVDTPTARAALVAWGADIDDSGLWPDGRLPGFPAPDKDTVEHTPTASRSTALSPVMTSSAASPWQNDLGHQPSIKPMMTALDADRGSMKILAGAKNLRELTLEGNRLDDLGLSYLAHCSRLERLSITSPQITDGGLYPLRQLPLKELEVQGTRLLGFGLRHFHSLEKLTWSVTGNVDLEENDFEARWMQESDGDGEPVADRRLSLAALKGLTRLRDLNLMGPFEHEQLEQIEQLAGLERLKIQTDISAPLIGLDFSRLARLKVLDLSSLTIDVAECPELLAAPNLEELLLPVGTSDLGLTYVSRLRSLRVLSVPGSTALTPAGLEQLLDLQHLRSLDFRNGMLTTEHLAVLSRMTRLESLSLGWCELNNASIDPLKGLRALKHLDLSGNYLGRGGLEPIAALTSLKQLILAGSAIVNKDLKPLTKLPAIEVIDLSDSGVTLAGLRRLREVLPRCTVIGESWQSLGDHLAAANGDWPQALEAAEAIFTSNKSGAIKTLELTSATDDCLTHLSALTDLEELDLQGDYQEITDTGLAALSKLTKLRKLKLSCEGISGLGLFFLKPLTKLEDIEIESTEFVLANLTHLHGLPLKRLILPELEGGADVAMTGVARFTQLEQLSPGSIGDDGLRRLAPLVHLKEIQLSYCPPTDQGLKSLQAFPDLEVLSLESVEGLSAAGLAHLAPLKKLRSLDLMDTSLSDKVLGRLPVLPSLEKLELRGTEAGPRTAKALSKLTNLRRLNLMDTEFDDAALKRLAGLTKLEELDLMNASITDEGAKHLAGMTNLHWLDLAGTQVGDDSLPVLGRLTRLKHLSLWGTTVTRHGLWSLTGLKRLEVINLPCEVHADVLPAVAQLSSLKELNLDANTSHQLVRELQRSLPRAEVWSQGEPAEDVMFD